jgi:hypothetical protein
MTIGFYLKFFPKKIQADSLTYRPVCGYTVNIHLEEQPLEKLETNISKTR